MHRLGQTQQRRHPRVPSHQTIHEAPPRPHDLARQTHHRVQKPLELHPHQAFSVQARLDITLYAQLLCRLSSGLRIARTPFFSCSIRFSWSQRSLAEKTISSAVLDRSLRRVEMWRGGVGGVYPFPALLFADASLTPPCSVSTSRSSNRTCGSPASGSRRGLTLSPTEDWRSAQASRPSRARRAGSGRRIAYFRHPALCAWHTTIGGADTKRADAPSGRPC